MSDSDGNTAMITVEMRAFLSDFSCSTPTLHLLAPILFWPGEVTYSELLGVKRVKGSPFKALSRLVCSHTRYAYCQGFLPCLFLTFRSILLHFFQTSPNVLTVAITGSSVGQQNKIGHPAGGRFPC